MRSDAAAAASRKPTLPWPHTPKRYGTFSLIRYSTMISAPLYVRGALSFLRAADAVVLLILRSSAVTNPDQSILIPTSLTTFDHTDSSRFTNWSNSSGVL